MSKYEREILEVVAIHKTVSVMELAEQLKVTDQTVRRVVKPMVERGEVKKVHGAIVAVDQPEDPPLPTRLISNRKEKAHIARMAAKLIPDGAAIAIDSGSTSSFIAQALVRHRGLTVVTNSAHIASLMAMVEGNRVYMAGTQLRSHDAAAFDQSAYEVILRLAVDYTVLSASLVHPVHGFLANDQHEVDMADAMSQIAEQRIMAVDNTKWRSKKTNATLRLPALRPGDQIITDKQPSDAYETLLKRGDLKVQWM